MPVCTTVCTGVGKRLHTLPSHPTLVGTSRYNSKVQAEECNVKEIELGALLKRGEAHDAFAIVRR